MKKGLLSDCPSLADLLGYRGFVSFLLKFKKLGNIFVLQNFT